MDLAKAGYVEEEYFISGQASRYTISGTNTATVLNSGNAYKTRIVVRRPTNAAKFNGVVIAEWTNVTNQWDQEVDWFQTHEHLLQQGYAWVGVDAQRVGLHSATGLKLWNPSRYGTLDLTVGNTVTNDSLAYDVFSQAVKAIKAPAGLDPLGSLPAPQYVVATGHSQSATQLRTYYNSIQPLSNILDAVVLHGGGGVMRTDIPQPVFRINSEGDIANSIGGAATRQADGPTFRLWEVSGASHGDWKLITDYGPLRKRDIGTYPGGYPGRAGHVRGAVAVAGSRSTWSRATSTTRRSTGSPTASRRRPRRTSPRRRPPARRSCVTRPASARAASGSPSRRRRCASTAARTPAPASASSTAPRRR